jgi:ribonuclease P protein component
VLARENRLSRRSVTFLLRKGSKLSTSLFSICYLPKKSQKPKFTVVISNKKMPLAPRRARVKRRMRAMIQQVWLPAQCPCDVVFFAQSSVYDIAPAILQQQMEQTLATVQRLSAASTDRSLSKNSITRP